MIEIIKQYWSHIVGIAGVIGAITKFYLDSLKIKEARLKITEAKLKIVNLETQINRKPENIIHGLTNEEIERYTSTPLVFKKWFKSFQSSPAITIVLVSVFVLPILYSSVIHFSQKNIVSPILLPSQDLKSVGEGSIKTDNKMEVTVPDKKSTENSSIKIIVNSVYQNATVMVDNQEVALVKNLPNFKIIALPKRLSKYKIEVKGYNADCLHEVVVDGDKVLFCE